MGEKRKTNQTLTVGLTPKERSEIIRRAEKSRMSLTDYILAASTQTEIYVAEDTRPLIAELKRIGNNLNQITMKINAGAFQSYNFHEVLDMQRAIYEELRRIGKG